MKRLIVVIIIVILLSIVNGLMAQSADKIIQDHVEALGGYDAIKSITSWKVSGINHMGDRETPFAAYWKAPNKSRREMEFMGNKMITGFDGDSAWAITPFGRGGRGGGRGGQGRFRGANMQLISPLLDYEDNGSTVEYKGRKSFEGTDTHKLVMTDPDGTKRTLYLDVDHYIILHMVTERKVQDNDIKTETSFSDFTDVKGVMIPFAFETKRSGGGFRRGRRGSGSTQTVIYEIETNLDLPDTLFTKPEEE